MKQQSLREWRDEKGLTQEQLAARCAETATAREKNIQLSQAAISNIEISRVQDPNWTTACILAEALEIDPRQIRFATDSDKLKRKAS